MDDKEPIGEVIIDATGDWLHFLLGTPLRIVLIAVVASIAVGLLRVFINRIEERVASDAQSPRERKLRFFARADLTQALRTSSPVSTQRRAQRARTLGSVLRSTATLLVGTIVLLMILDEVGVSVAPLLASAGIVGVALGFGAQALVKDFLSGIFMLAEDQYGVGDVVDVGEAIGVVEEVGLRVTQVRSLDGTLWYVRNGEILRVGNMTQVWSRLVFDLKIDFQEDSNQAKLILQQVAADLALAEEWAPKVLEDPTVTGVEAIDGEGFTLRMLVKTAPGEQWGVGREVRKRTKIALDDAGISLALSQVRIEPTPK